MKGKKNSKVKYTVKTKTAWIINIIFVILLLITYLNSYINPESFPYLAITALAYPFLLIINILFILLWLIRGRLAFLYSTVALLLGLNHIFSHFQFNQAGETLATNKPTLTILTYNVHLFGYYDRSDNNETRSGMFDLLEKSDADIYCFQEFFEPRSEISMVDTLKSMLKTPYVYVDYFLTTRKLNRYGLAIFSRYPILDTGNIHQITRHSNYSIYADVLWDQDTIRVFSSHLQSIRLSKTDYTFYQELTTHPTDNKDVKGGSLSIIKKLNNAYEKRADQAHLLKDKMDQSPYPVIVCGDFNDTPLSYVYRKISSGLRDGFIQAGFGIGKTYSGLFPSYRIDYILFSPKYRAKEYHTIRKNFSDHYPVVVKLTASQLRDKKQNKNSAI